MSRLADCPSRPSCVCSDSGGARHGIDPFDGAGDLAGTWARLVSLVRATPRVEVLTETDDYLHAVYRTRLFGFRDDVELEQRSEQGQIAVRSCSRIGHWDLGTNRRRLEGLRRRLASGAPTAYHP